MEIGFFTIHFINLLIHRIDFLLLKFEAGGVFCWSEAEAWSSTEFVVFIDAETASRP